MTNGEIMRFLTILSLVLVAVTLATSLAHALEWPGKRRLGEADYRTTQAIYYPGFTFGGLFGEFGGIVSLAVLLYLTPEDTSRFWWTAGALLLMLAGHSVYWLMIHPINNFWVKDVATSAAGSTFFSTFAGMRNGDWTELRDTWERSHAVRACLHVLSLIAIAMATSLFS